MNHSFLLLLTGLFLGAGISNASDIDTCGVSGTLQERIQDCDKTFGELASKKIPVNDPFEPSGTYDWHLVTRTQERSQVWYDATSKLVWADTARDDYTFENSLKFCHGEKSGSDVKGTGQLSFTGKNLLGFTLPTQGELKAALVHGALVTLPNWRKDEGIFWTASTSNNFSVCSSTHTPGYYTGSGHAFTWVPGYYSYQCRPTALMATLTIKENKPGWNSRTLMFGDTGAVKCVARANE